MRHPNKKWINITQYKVAGKKDRNLPEYQQWMNIRNRCKVGGDSQVRRPTYIGCTYAVEWESYDNYIEWAKQQIGFLSKDSNGNTYRCDKDLLIKGNKHYSPETCVFIPEQVNIFLTKRQSSRGVLPIGVHQLKGYSKYIAQSGFGKGSKYLGLFDTPEAAFAVYKIAKEAYAKELATKYTGLVDPRVIDALNNYVVEITD